MLHVSISSIQDWLVCRRLYYYKRIKKYSRFEFDIPFLVGRVMHIGIGALLKKQTNAESLMLKCFEDEKKAANDVLVLSPEQHEDLNEQKYVVQGMLRAYSKRYGKMLKDVKLIDNEVEGSIEINKNVRLVFKLDNLLKIRKKKVLHELKTSKYITPDYVKSIQTNFQTSVYFYAYNAVYNNNKIDEIMFDIVRKPSIRPKKGEAYQAYLTRLSEWYDKPDDMSVFHIERFNKPKIEEKAIWNTVENVGKEILKCNKEEDYYQNFDYCHGYYGKRCPYYELCHEGGETKENLVLYNVRKPYYISK